jgi:spore germination protein GerM
MDERLDAKIRELTVRLMESAPEAPPFPEDTMSHLVPEPPRRRLRPLWVAAAGAAAVIVLVGVPLWLIGGGDGAPAGGDGTTSNPTTTTEPPCVSGGNDPSCATTTTQPAVPSPTDVTLYFLADYVEDAGRPGPWLVPVGRTVDAANSTFSMGTETGALAVTIEALLAGPTAADAVLVPGVSSAVPEGSTLISYSFDAGSGVATLDFNAAIESGGGTFSMGARLAQIVYTATRFPGVEGVVVSIDGRPVDVFSSEGIVLDGPQTRDDYRDLLPLILVESPLPGATVSSPVRITGIANTFEAGLVYLIETADGTVFVDGPATASCGTGCWGDFTIDVEYRMAEPGAGFVVVYEVSAEDGRPVNRVRIPVTLEASGPPSGDLIDLEIHGLFNPQYNSQGAAFDGGYTTSPTVIIGGSVTPGAEVTVTPGIVTVPPDQGGGFEAEVSLEPGVNTIVVEAMLAGQVGRLEQTVTYLPDGETNFAFLTKATATELMADYAQWLSGDEANQAAFEDGVIGSVEEGVPNDYYIRNVNDLLRTLPLSPDAVVSLPTSRSGPVLNVLVQVDEWLGLFKDDGTPWDYEAGDRPPVVEDSHFGAGSVGFGYWLTVDGSGTVVQVIGQYRP